MGHIMKKKIGTDYEKAAWWQVVAKGKEEKRTHIVGEFHFQDYKSSNY